MLRVKWLSLLALFNLTVQSVAAGGAQVPARPVSRPPVQVVAEGAERRKETFQIVWQTVKEQHFDPTFGGLDWDAVRRDFAPRVAQVQSDRELHRLLQEMLNRLGQSHFAIIPPESIPAVVPDDPDRAETDDAPGEDAPDAAPTDGRNVTAQLTHGIGLDLRIINGAAIISRVEPLSAAARAGLRPGFVLQSVNGHRLSTILRMLTRASVYQPMVKHQLPTEIVVGYFNGAPGTFARIAYLDARNVLRRVSVRREKLQGEMSPPLPSLPPQFVEFESKRLRGGVGYIRFNVFAVPVMDKFCAALRALGDAPGIVIDLRGNRGGLLAMLYGMGGLLAARPIAFGEMRTRAGIIPFTTLPQRKPYGGQLVVLIDGTSLSASEILASGLRESGRALVIGEQSGGLTLASVAKELPTGAILQYAFADFVSWYGNRIEGHGVNPDVTVKLNRRSLLAGRDAQLEAAIDAVATTVTRPPSVTVADAAPAPPETDEEKDGVNEAAAPSSTSSTSSPSPTSSPSSASSPVASSVNEAAAEQLIERILEKYVEAIGGRATVEKISSRLSKGTVNGSFSGIPLSGTIETVEKLPDRSLSIVTFASAGVVRRGFTGTHGYEQISLYGYREITGPELADLKLGSDLHWSLKLRQLYPKMSLQERERIGDSEVYVIEATPARGRPTKLYFAADTGLLLRKDEVYFEDYRKVDGLMLPFVFRGGQTVVTLTEVTHNAPVDDDAFLERKDCFTQ